MAFVKKGILIAAFGLALAGCGAPPAEIQKSEAKHAIEDAGYTDVTVAYDRGVTMSQCGKDGDARGWVFSARDAAGKHAEGWVCVGPATTPKIHPKP